MRKSKFQVVKIVCTTLALIFLLHKLLYDSELGRQRTFRCAGLFANKFAFRSTLIFLYLSQGSKNAIEVEDFYHCMSLKNLKVLTFATDATLTSYSELVQKYSTNKNLEFFPIGMNEKLTNNITNDDLIQNFSVYSQLLVKNYSKAKVMHFNLRELLSYKSVTYKLHTLTKCQFFVGELAVGGKRSEMACLFDCLNSRIYPIASSSSPTTTPPVKYRAHTVWSCILNSGCFNGHYLKSCGLQIKKVGKMNVYTYCCKYNPAYMCQDYHTAQPQLRSTSTNSKQSTKKEIKNTDISADAKDEDIHLVFASDQKHFIGTEAAVRSVIKTSKSRHRLFFHVFECINCDYDQKEELANLVSLVENCGSKIQIHSYKAEETWPYINRHQEIRTELQTPNNYVRFLLADKLPHISKCVWMDSDILVLSDIIPIVDSARVIDKTLASTPTFKSPLVKESAFRRIIQLGVNISKVRLPRFCAGFVVINLARWRRTNVTEKVLLISKINREMLLYKNLGSQPPLTLLFSGERFEQLNIELVHNLGYNENTDVPCGAHILHWSGNNKPWMEDGFNKDIWSRINPITNHLGEFMCAD